VSGLGGLNPSPGALVLGLVQAQVPVVTEPGHLTDAATKIATMIRGAKEGMPSLDLLVFPEYSINGLNPKSWMDDRLLCDLDASPAAAGVDGLSLGRTPGLARTCRSVAERVLVPVTRSAFTGAT